jgi:hypothetical protein
MPKGTDALHYHARISKDVERAVEASLFFSAFTKDLKVTTGKGKQIIDVNGESGIVNQIKGFDTANGLDSCLIPVQKPLEVPAVYGDQDLEATGEKLSFNLKRCFINQGSKVVTLKEGNMSAYRERNLERSEERGVPAIVEFWSKQKNSEMISALYEGHSYNTTVGLNNAPGGIGAKQALHPNMYYNTVNATTGQSGSIITIGSEKVNKTPAEINAKISTGYSDLTLPSPYMFDAVIEKLKKLKILEPVKFMGSKFYLCVASLAVRRALMANEAFIKRIDTLTDVLAEFRHNPYFSALDLVMDNVILKFDDIVSRPWNSTNSTFMGTHYMLENSYASGENHAFLYFLGKGALGAGLVDPVRVETQQRNFRQAKEAALMEIYGYARGESVSDADEANYFSKGNRTRTVNTSQFDVLNQTSMMLACKV